MNWLTTFTCRLRVTLMIFALCVAIPAQTSIAKTHNGSGQTIADIAKVEVKTTVKSISEQRPGTIYLVVTNISDQEIEVSRLTVFSPTIETQSDQSQKGTGAKTFIEFDVQGGLEKKKDPWSRGVTFHIENPTLPRHQAMVIPVTVKVPGRVQPGTHMVVFDIELSWDDTKGNIVTTHEIDVGIFGESDIYRLLGVPSLILLPGFLIVVTWWYCWLGWRGLGRIVGREAAGEFPIKWKTPQFWGLAILLSLVYAGAYSSLTRYDYLIAYSYRDFLKVVFYSIVAGFVLFVLLGLCYYIPRWIWRRWLQNWKTISRHDSPSLVLKKLGRLRRDTINLEQARVKLKNKPRLGLLTVPVLGVLEDDVSYVIVPQIEIRFAKRKGSEEQRAVKELRDRLNKELKRDKPSARAVARIIIGGLKNGWLNTMPKWHQRDGWVKTPRVAKSDRAERVFERECVVIIK